ncbi:unnamed protein product (mitochondrion) [Plasmodiophora brassicae]|uniref:Condensin complex subunit 2 n=1 Tax=Plasmodiophora brassicae TaxID=37360 RepID=A0A3P3Y4H8_PLABS|nr:unnamed protein product [Plasmodiophora brassicae]
MGRNRRLSSGFGLVVGEVPGAPPALLERNDDEAERELLRVQREQRRLSHTPTSSRRRQSILQCRAEPSQNVTEMYERCIKMSAENKINRQNTWDLTLIDHIDDVLGEAGTSTNFQKASCTLDASVKIYSYRVDSVHYDMFKVLGGLHRSDQAADTGEDSEGGDTADEDRPAARQSRSRRAPQMGSTLESRPATLLTSLPDLLFEVDPMFQRTASSFDEGGARGLLLNQLAVGQGCNIVFDFATPDPDDAAMEDDAPAAFDMTSLSEYWSSQISQRAPLVLSALTETLQNMCGAISDRSVLPSSVVPEEVQDDHGVMYDDADDDYDAGGPEDGFEGVVQDHDADRLFGSPEVELASAQEAALSRDLTQEDINGGGLLSSDLPLLPVWASPAPQSRQSNAFGSPGAGTSHWKFRGGHAPPPDDVSDDAGTKSVRRGKPGPTADFSGPPVDLDCLADPARSTNTLSQATIDKMKAANYLLPVDLHLDAQSLRRLFARPDVIMRMSGSGARLADLDDGRNVESVAYDYNNDNDQLNFCPGGPSDDDYDGDHPFGFAQTELDLVEQPRMAEKVDIDFAKSAKRVDIKAVKHTLWATLERKTEDAPPLTVDQCQVAENPQEIVDPDVRSEQGDDHGAWPSFSESVKSISVPDSSRESMSIQLFFVCLLHLANENDLLLKPGSDLGDFSIARRASDSSTEK